MRIDFALEAIPAETRKLVEKKALAEGKTLLQVIVDLVQKYASAEASDHIA